jgi:cobalt-zinc-cadmium efflux system outer membrane protein
MVSFRYCVLAPGLLLSACVASSIRSDVSKVETLAHAQALPELPQGKVETTPSRDTEELLAQPLDANSAVRVALLNNRELRARLRALGVERGRLMQAGLLENPALEAEVAPERESRVEVRAEYDVMSFVIMPMRKTAAKHELEAARLDAAGDVVELGYQVRGAFYALCASEQRLATAQVSLDAFAASSDAARAMLAAGNITELDASTQISAFERARIVVAKLELEVAERREELQRRLGLHGGPTRWSLAGPLEPAPEEALPAGDLATKVHEANLDLQALERRVAALGKRAGIARTEGLLPRLDVDVHALIGNPDPSLPSNLRWGGGVGLDVPVFNRNQGTRRALLAELDQNLELYQGLAINLQSQLRETTARVLSAHKRARQYQQVIVPAQNQVMLHTQLQYNAMQLGVFQLLEARRAQLEVALDYAETLREFWSARAELAALIEGRMVGARALEAAVTLGAGASEGGGH